jgi:hypothetical protein
VLLTRLRSSARRRLSRRLELFTAISASLLVYYHGTYRVDSIGVNYESRVGSSQSHRVAGNNGNGSRSGEEMKRAATNYLFSLLITVTDGRTMTMDDGH